MKSKFWQMKTFVVLLFLICIAKSEIPKPILNNWIEISTRESWPSPESSTNLQSFYIYHPDWVRKGFKHFGFNTNFLSNIELIGDLELSFKYWCNDDLGRFRATDARRAHHNIVLNQTNKLFQHWWQFSQTSHITKELWSNYSFIDGEDFLAAFKDVSVMFTQKVDASKLAKNSIHGYQATSRTLNIATKSGSTTNFTVNPSNSAFLTRIDSQPVNQDMCYTIAKSNAVAIEIYLTFEGVQSGTHLTTLTSNHKKFCISDFIALQNLIKYQLTILVPQRVDKAFELFIEAKAESHKFQLKAPIRSIHDQLADVITDGWYFYHPHFSFEIHGFEAKAEDQAKFWLCDIVSNCFPYDLQRDEHHRSAVYSISPLVKSILDKSPFVRIKSNVDLSIESHKRKYELFYNAWSTQNIEQNLRENFDWVNYKRKAVPGMISSGSHIMRANNTHTTVSFQIPIESVDLRAFQMHTTVSKIAVHENSTVTINKVTFKPESSSTAVDLTEIAKLKFQYHLNQIPDVKPIAKPTPRPGAHTPKPDIHPIVKSAKEDIAFIISTDDFFFVEAFNAAGKSVKGTFSVEITAVPEDGAQSVGMSMNNQLVQRQVQPQTTTVSSLKLQVPNDPILKHTTNPSIDHTKLMLSSGLIRSPVDRKLPPYSVSIKATSRLTNKPLKAGDITLTRYVLSHGALQSTSKTASLKINAGSVIFEETSSEQITLLGAAFEFLFLLELKDLTQEVVVSVNKFELKPDQGLPSKQTGPIISTMNTKFDRFLCPTTFKANAANSSCSLDTVYQQMSITCDTLSGCPSIFNPPLLTSEVYYDSRHSSYRYFPTKIETSAVKTDPLISTIEIRKPNNSTVFCVDFAYKSTDVLLVSSEPSRQDVKSSTFPAASTETKGHICSDKLTPSTSSSMYFRFDAKQQRALGSSYITNLNVTASK